jgi:hypothetical protein
MSLLIVDYPLFELQINAQDMPKWEALLASVFRKNNVLSGTR